MSRCLAWSCIPLLNPFLCLLTNNGNRAAQSWKQFPQFATASTHTDCPILVYFAREKRKIKRHSRISQNITPDKTRSHGRAKFSFHYWCGISSSSPSQSQQHCIRTPEQGPFILHKLVRARHKYVAQNNTQQKVTTSQENTQTMLSTLRCESSEPTLQQDASHHSRWVLHCRSHHASFSLVIH